MTAPEDRKEGCYAFLKIKLTVTPLSSPDINSTLPFMAF
jgi:hypothetical protein